MHSRDRQEDWTNFKRMENEVNKELKRVKKESFYQREILNREGDEKDTWTVINSIMNRKSKKNTQINEIKPISGKLLPSAKNLANYLDKHFFFRNW